MELTVQWNGHSCFSLTYDDYTIVMDPYADYYVPGLAPLRVSGHEVLCSHSHRDHSAAELVTLLPPRQSPFQVTALPSYHDPEQGALRGLNTIFLLTCGDLRIAHFGDLGCSPTAEQIALLQNLDVAMVPIGGYYTIHPQGAAELLSRLKPRIAFPMHYRNDDFGFDVLSTLEDFLALESGVIFYPGNSRTLDKQSPAEISVLHYEG